MIIKIIDNVPHQIIDIQFGNLNIVKMVKNGKILWERIVDIITGVINSGIWVNNNIWSNSEVWKNN